MNVLKTLLPKTFWIWALMSRASAVRLSCIVMRTPRIFNAGLGRARTFSMVSEAWFPFSTATATDPVSGKTAAIFHGDKTDPLMMQTNTPSEYWQKGASLLTTDPAGARDLDEHPKARTYLIAGTQHVGNFNTPASPGACAMPRNPHDAYPAIRALLAALGIPRELLPRLFTRGARGSAGAESTHGLGLYIVRQAMRRQMQRLRRAPRRFRQVIAESGHHRPRTATAVEYPVDEETGAHIGTGFDHRIEAGMCRQISGIVMIEVAHFRAGGERRRNRRGIARERQIEHCYFVAVCRLDALDQRDFTLGAGDQFGRARRLQTQLVQRADAVRISVENIIE